MSNKRKKVWIDRFQTVLCIRIALYLIVYQVAVWTVAVTEQRLGGRLANSLGQEWGDHLQSMLGLGLLYLGAVFVFDALRTAHRLVGPLYRFRQMMKAIASGEELELIRLRKSDMLQEMKDDFNEMLEALEQRGAVVLRRPAVHPHEAEHSTI